MQTGLMPFLCQRAMSFIGLLLISISALGQSKKSDSFFNQGVELYRNAQYEEAIPFLEKAVALDKKEISPDSARYDYSSDWLASCYYKLGNVSKAKEISPFFYSFEPVDRRLTIESDKEADLANRLQQEGKIEESIQHALNCLRLEEAALGQWSLHCVGSYLTIADLYAQLGDNNQALINYNNGLAVLCMLGIDNSMFNFNLLMGRVLAHLSNNDIQSALSDMNLLKSISDYLKQKDENAYPAAQVDLLYARIGVQNQDYDHATNHAVSAFKSLLEQYEPADENVFGSLIDCVRTLIMLSRQDELIPLLQEAIGHISDNRGHKGILLSYLAECNGDIPTCQESLHFLSGTIYLDMYQSTKCMLASFYKANGEVLKSIEMNRQVCDYYMTKYPQSATYRHALMSLGETYAEMGDYSQSNDCYKKILSLLENDKNSPDYILTLMKWVPIYMEYSVTSGTFNENDGGFSEGFELGKELSHLMANMRISDFVDNGIGLSTIAHVMIDFIHAILRRAVLCSTISWNEMESSLSQLTYDYLVPLCTDNHYVTHRAKATLAHVKYLLGKNSEAIKLLEEVIISCKSMNFPYDNYLHDLAYYQYDSGDKMGAYQNFRVGYEFNKNRILSGYRWMTMDERNKLTRAFRGNLDNIPHYAAITPEDPRYAELGYDALLFTKGLLLNSTIELSQLLQEEGHKESLSLLGKWQKMNQEYQALQQKGLHDKAHKLKERIDNLERELIAVSKAYGDYTNGLTVSYSGVQANLGEGDMAVEFFSYQKDASSRMYGALVLTKNQAPQYVPIGLDKEWRMLMENCYADDRLFNTLFSNLKPYLPNAREGSIYFSADGLLHTIAIENLPGAESYSFKRLSSTRVIALKPADAEPIKKMVVIGGVKYGLGNLAELYLEEDRDRGALQHLSYLPGTKREARTVCQLFAHKVHVDSLMAEGATETNFKKLSGQRVGLLHIGTHGFFRQPADISDPSLFETEVMKSSGLYFAGAQNTLWSEPIRGMKDDGILTAQEISALDLRGLKLSVLSACETGRGTIGPDGVFGLQRGFKQAGAEGILMSLWKVDDQATQILMEEFYRQILNGADPYVALRESQKRVRLKYPDPKYWAAFILVDAISKLEL